MAKLLTCVIIDDEQHCIDTLQHDINLHCKEKLSIIGTSTDAVVGFKMLTKLLPDIVFLDIELPGVTGLDMMEMADFPIKVVFTTAHSKYAIEAHRYNTEAYLLKPVDADELTKVADRMYNAQGKSGLKDRLIISDHQGLEFIKHEDIVYCNSEDNYTRVFLVNQEQRTISKTLKYVEKQLYGKDFIRIHHSYLININHLQKYVRQDGGTVKLTDGTELSVSRNYKNNLQILLSNT